MKDGPESPILRPVSRIKDSGSAKKLNPQHYSDSNPDCRGCNIAGLSELCKADEVAESILQEVKTLISLRAKERLVLNEKNRNSIFLIRDGVIKLKTSFEGFKGLDLLYKGSFLGSLDLPGVEIEVEAGDESSLCEITTDAVEKLIQSNSRFINKYLLAIGLHAASLKLQRNQASKQSVVGLLAKALYKDFRSRGYKYDGSIRVTKILSQEEWASYLGSRRESISRAFSQLERDKIVATKDGSIILQSEYELLNLIYKSSAPQKQL